MSRLPAVALLAAACAAFAPDDESKLLELIRQYESSKDLAVVARIFNDHQATLEKATAAGRVTPAQWETIRAGKLQIVSNFSRDFMNGQAAPKSGRYVLRLDHMGTSGTVAQYTPTSDCDLRPDHAYHGIETDIEEVAKAHGVKNLKSWNINILSPTDVSSVEKFLKEQRNPEKYALKGALAFLEHTQYTTNVTEAAELVDGKPRYKGKVPMSQSGAPAVPPPDAMDALDYMVEMRMRAHGDLEHMVGLGGFDANDADAMKSFRKYAKDLYKYAGTRATGEAMPVAGIDPSLLDPAVAARLAEYRARAPRIKENVNELGNDPQRIMRESRQMAADLDALLDAAMKSQVARLAQAARGMPELTPENLSQLQGRLNELTDMKMRMAMQMVRGGSAVEDLLKKHFKDHPELWKDVVSLKEYAQLELAKTAKGLGGHYARRVDIERAHRATADRFMNDVLARLRDKSDVLDTTPVEGRLRQVRAAAPKVDAPGRGTPRNGAARLYAHHANRRLESFSPRWKHVDGATYWFPEIADMTDAIVDDWKRFTGGEWMDRLRRDIPDFRRLPGDFAAGLVDWQRSSILTGLADQWKAFSAWDKDLLKAGRSFAYNLVKVEGVGDGIDKLGNLADFWVIAYATYHDGWDGFWLSTGEWAADEAMQAAFAWFMMKALPYILERVGLENAAAACPGIGQALLIAYTAKGVLELLKSGIDAAVDYFITQGFRDEQVERFYDWHPEGSRLRTEGFGFFDPERRGEGLTRAQLWRGNDRRKGYASARELLTGIRQHRSDLVKLPGGPARARTHGGEGMKIWSQIEETALADWAADLMRAANEAREAMKRARGGLRTADIDALPADSRSQPVFARILESSSGAAERVGDRWRATPKVHVATAAMPGTRAKIRVIARIDGTDRQAQTDVDVVRGESMEPKDLMETLKAGFQFDFDAAGEVTVSFTVTDPETGRVLDSTRHAMGVGYGGTIDELTVEASQGAPFRAVEELRAGESAVALVTDRLTGFDAVEKKSVEVWFEDERGARVSGVSGAVSAPRAERGVEVAFSVPATIAPGSYALCAKETLWRVTREARTTVRIGAPRPRFSNFRCVVSIHPEGRPATGTFLRGDDIRTRVEFDAQYAPRGTTANVRFTAQREGGRAVGISGGAFAVSDGANGWTRPEVTRVGANAPPAEWTVRAIVEIAGEEFTAETSFRVTDQTIRLSPLVTTWGMNERTPSSVFALGDTVWCIAEYEVASIREQALLVVWETQRPGADAWREVARSAVPIGAGRHTSMRALPVGRDPKALGAHRVRVTLRADAQPGVSSEADVEVKRAIEWSNPPLIAAWSSDAVAAATDFRCGEPFNAVMRFRLNVDNGRRFRFEVKTYDPQGREYAPCSGTLAPQPVVLGERIAWVPSTMPAKTEQVPEGRYTVVARVWSDNDMIEERTTFDVHVPAKIWTLQTTAGKGVANQKNQFKPGEAFGWRLDYSLQHVRAGEKAKLVVQMFQEASQQYFWPLEWSWDAKDQPLTTLTEGGALPADFPEGKYHVVADLTVGGFTWRSTAPYTVGIYPDIVITSPLDRSETRERVIAVTGTIADRRIQRAVIALNGQQKALAVSNGAFTEKMVLRPGWNQITVTAQNALGTDTKTVWVTADIPAALVKIVLDWSENASDVDLWVIDPQGVTTSFQAKQPRPDRNLDIDNTSGFGPETYTCFNWDLRGDYTVIVKYYADKGARQVGTHVRWTLYEGTQWETGSETQWITLDHAAGTREERGASYRFTIRVP